MKKGTKRIVFGSLLPLLQALSIAGSIKTGTFHAPSPPLSLSQLAYDMIVLASANLPGILGAILLISGLTASRKAKKLASKETESPQLPGTDTVIDPEPEQKPDTTDSSGDLPTPELPLPNTRFCKLCGDPIDPVTRKCTGCKKQYFRLPVFTDKHYFIAATAVACVVIASLLAVLVFQNNQITELNAQMQGLNIQISELETDHSDCESTIVDLQRDLQIKDNSIETLEQKLESMRKKIAELDNCIAFVVDGSRLYHTFNCSMWSSSDSIWIYRLEEAKSNGYSSCYLCHR